MKDLHNNEEHSKISIENNIIFGEDNYTRKYYDLQ